MKVSCGFFRGAIVSSLTLFSACAPLEVHEQESAPEYMTARATSFYRYGPAQPGEPDEVPAGSLLRLLKKGRGYSQVIIEDGRSGYVATEDIKAAPPTARAVDGGELFPAPVHRPPPLPEPDFDLPVLEVPSNLSDLR